MEKALVGNRIPDLPLNWCVTLGKVFLFSGSQPPLFKM